MLSTWHIAVCIICTIYVTCSHSTYNRLKQSEQPEGIIIVTKTDNYKDVNASQEGDSVKNTPKGEFWNNGMDTW